MARQPRFVLIGQPQHVIIRGNNRQAIFFEQYDYEFYLEILKKATQKHDCEVHAYVLMTNHVHLLITPNKADGISKLIQMIGRYYVQHFNFTYTRTGTLWEGRYKATLIDSEQYLLTCYRYIELNPVRAKMVNAPEEYPWSSYHANGLAKQDELISPHPTYLALGKTTAQQTESYRGLFSDAIPQATIDEIRQSTNKAWVLGNDQFKKQIETKTERPCSPRKKGRKAKE
ncbi:MAG: transposase [Thiomicrorhabdus sp.]|jgi:putative transposase|nr:transposase [Thiomicrorhabdus sp.]